MAYFFMSLLLHKM